MHDSATKAETVKALPKIIEHYRSKGYSFGSLQNSTYPITFRLPELNMNTKIQDKKSNARIAWEEFISNFSLNDKKNTSVKPAGNGTAVYSSPETTVRNTDEKPAFNFREYNEPEIVPPARLVPPRTTVIGEQVDITGNCKIEGDVEIYGEITGDVQAGGTIVVFGKVTGNMSGKNVILNAARVKGSIIGRRNNRTR